MGDIELFLTWLIISLLAFFLFYLINIFSFKNFFKRFGFVKYNRKDFYECGFKPKVQKPIQISIQFLFFCIFFLLYDIEFIFFIPFFSNFDSLIFIDLIWLIFFFLIFFFSFLIDLERHALYYQNI